MSFHVPEHARGTYLVAPDLVGTKADGNNGGFDLPSPEPGWGLTCMASDGEGWEHVSVHAYNEAMTKQRVPTWKEMHFVKQTFWDPEDVVMQLHPRTSAYVNVHQYVLHLWRPTDATIPTPPSWMVGVKPGDMVGVKFL